MMASLYQRPLSSGAVSTLISERTSTLSSQGKAAKQHGGIVRRIDAQPHPAPFNGMPLGGDQVLDRAHRSARTHGADLDIAEMEPELARSFAGESDRDCNGVVAGG